MEEIAKNDYNLNISCYENTALEEELIDLLEVNKRLMEIEEKITDARKMHNAILWDLGLPPFK